MVCGQGVGFSSVGTSVVTMWLMAARVVNLAAISGSGVNIQVCPLNMNYVLDFVTGAMGGAEGVASCCESDHCWYVVTLMGILGAVDVARGFRDCFGGDVEVRMLWDRVQWICD